MARPWAVCAALLTLSVILHSLSVTTIFPGLSTTTNAMASSCMGGGVSASPSTVNTPGQVTITADGFAPGSAVFINISPPPGWSFTAQMQPQADSNCMAMSAIQINSCPTCPSGTATVTASGKSISGPTVTYQGSFFISSPGSSSQTGHTPMPMPSNLPVPSTCQAPTASTTPTIITQGQQTTFVAQGFAPQSTVNIQITGPGAPATATAVANSLCQVATTVTFQFTDPPGTWTFTATGQPYSQPGFAASNSLLTLSANVQVLAAATPTISGPTVTSGAVCPNPSVNILAAPVVTGQQASFTAFGFRPGAFVQVRLEDPATGAQVPFFADSQVGPATTTCSVSGSFTANSSVPVGRYRLSLSGLNHLGSPVTARQDFDVVAAQGTGPTSTPAGPVVGPTATPTLVTGPAPAAPVAIQQTLAIIGGAQVPQVGVSSTYGHVIRVTNTSASAIDSSTLAGLLEVLAASLQGQGVNMSFTTDYAEGSRITAATANIGSADVRGSSVTWSGQIQAGQSLELRTAFDQVPTTALAVNQPIRGQTFAVSDVRGTSLALAAPPPAPRLPVAQRVVQPPPPPVDPITGPRFFATTGFGIGDENIWTYFVRRGGFRTFGAPISRQFTLSGTQVQLFEKGMLALDADNNVVSINLLEDPLLPYDTVGELRLPPIDSTMLASFPDPAAPTFADDIQEFVRVNTPESFDQRSTRFYATYLATVLYADAFFLGPGDPNLLPGFDLEIWGVPVSQPGYQVVGYELVPGGGPDGEDIQRPIVDPNVVLQRFQRGVMRYDNSSGTTSAAAIGPYLRAVLTGQATDEEFVAAASASPLWAQYNSDGDPGTWLDRPDDLPDTNLQLAFEPQTE